MASKIVTRYLPEFFALGIFRSKPAMVTVNLTKRCNQRCIYCEIGKSPFPEGKETLTKEDLTWIIDEMDAENIRRISLCGGEPFLFAGILEVIAYAGQKNIRCSVTTNGMTAHRLNDAELRILRECRAEVNVSIDSFREEVQSLTRGSAAALPNALRSVRRLSEAGIPVTVLTVISKYNYDDLFTFTRSAFEKGIRQVLFQPVIYSSNYPDLPPLENKAQLNVDPGKLDLLTDELKKILRFEKTHRIRTNVYRILPWISDYLMTAAAPDGSWFFSKVLDKFYCRELFAIIDISYDGGIQPCGLTQASVFITRRGPSGLMDLWQEATRTIKEDLGGGRFYDCCNGCCHHFSRNMLASLVKHPVRNHKALSRMMPILISRAHSRILKQLSFHTQNRHR
jgi:MoaA/NifB/PqqE/SkfB family radical SAM enzyme